MRVPGSSDLGVSCVLTTAPALTLMMELHLSRSFLSRSTSSASLIVPTCTLPATDLAFTGARRKVVAHRFRLEQKRNNGALVCSTPAHPYN